MWPFLVSSLTKILAAHGFNIHVLYLASPYCARTTIANQTSRSVEDGVTFIGLPSPRVPIGKDAMSWMSRSYRVYEFLLSHEDTYSIVIAHDYMVREVLNMPIIIYVYDTIHMNSKGRRT